MQKQILLIRGKRQACVSLLNSGLDGSRSYEIADYHEWLRKQQRLRARLRLRLRFRMRIRDAKACHFQVDGYTRAAGFHNLSFPHKFH